ncbi:MAG: hypothetical protein ACREP9_23695 [Candidatus Dormibacteraceae bacterium]
MRHGNDPTGYSVILGVVLLVLMIWVIWAVPIVVRKVRNRRYRDGVAAWAATHEGWSYREGGGGPWAQQLEQGQARGVTFHIDGTRRNRPVTVAHYWYRTSADAAATGWVEGSYTTTHDLTVCLVHLPGVYPAISVKIRGAVYPAIPVKARDIGWRIARGLGFPVLYGLGEDAFDRVYQVRTEVPELSRSVITPALVEAHLAGTVPPWSLREHDLLATWNGKVKPDLIPSHLDQLLNVADLLGTI